MLERQSYRVIKSCSIPLLFIGVFNLVILFVSYDKATFYMHKLDQVKISGDLTAIRMTSVHANDSAQLFSTGRIKTSIVQ